MYTPRLSSAATNSIILTAMPGIVFCICPSCLMRTILLRFLMLGNLLEIYCYWFIHCWVYLCLIWFLQMPSKADLQAPNSYTSIINKMENTITQAHMFGNSHFFKLMYNVCIWGFKPHSHYKIEPIYNKKLINLKQMKLSKCIYTSQL